MAKKAMRKKKRKYVRRTLKDIPKMMEYGNAGLDKTEPIPDSNKVEEVRRADENSYIFADAGRILIRHMNDYNLNLNQAKIANEINEVERRLRTLESVHTNILREQTFRKLR